MNANDIEPTLGYNQKGYIEEKDQKYRACIQIHIVGMDDVLSAESEWFDSKRKANEFLIMNYVSWTEELLIQHGAES